MRIVEQFGRGAQRRGRNCQPVQQFNPFGGGPRQKGFGEQAVDPVDLCRAHFQADHVGRRPLRPDRADESRPVLVVVDQRRNVPILGGVRLAVGRDHARIKRLAQRGRKHRAIGVFDQHERGHRLEHRDLDLLAFAGARLVEQRHHRGVKRGQARDLVGHDRAQVCRRAGQLLLQRHQPAFGLDRIVVCRAVALGAAMTIAVAVGIDDAGVDRRHRFVVEPQFLHRRRAHRVDEHIGAFDQLAQRRLARLGFQIEHHRALAPVDVDIHPRQPRRGRDRDIARGIAFRRLDLDHVGAHVGHDLRGIWPEHHRGEIDHADAPEWSFGVRPGCGFAGHGPALAGLAHQIHRRRLRSANIAPAALRLVPATASPARSPNQDGRNIAWISTSVQTSRKSARQS